MKAQLYAPKAYWDMDPKMVDEITGGCGPGGVGDRFVPDTVYLLSIFDACRIHDWMYRFGETLADKDEADRIFLNNMVRIVEASRGPKWLKKLRLRRVQKYYLAVHLLGGSAFWKGKNDEKNLSTVS